MMMSKVSRCATAGRSKPCTWLAAMGLVLASAGHAAIEDPGPAYQAGSYAQGHVAPAGADDCGSGPYVEIYDNGSAQNGYGANPDIADTVTLVQRFNPGGGRVRYTQVCFGLTRTGGEADSFSFEIVAYNGATGAPSVELAAVSVLAPNVPPFPAFAWYAFDLSSLPIDVEHPIFLGARWAPDKSAVHLIAVDENDATPYNRGYFNAHRGAGWQLMENQTGFERYSALMVRAVRQPLADLALFKQAQVLPPATVTFELSVSNNGPDDASGVTVDDPLPACTDYISDDCGGEGSGPWRWPIGDLASGATVSCTLSVDARACATLGMQSNTATVAGEQDDPDPDNNTASADFEIIAHTVTATVVAGQGTVAPDQQQVLSGESAEFTVIPASGWRVGDMAGDRCTPQDQGGGLWSAAGIEADCVVTVAFEPITYALVVHIEGEGAVDIDPHQPEYHHGDTVTLMPVADSDWAFSEWRGDADGDADPLIVVIENDTEITAVFEPSSLPPYTLTVSIVGEGSVSIDPDQETYADGEEVTLTATPAAQWSFVHWTGDVPGQTSTDRELHVVMDSDRHIQALFQTGDGEEPEPPDQTAVAIPAMEHFGLLLLALMSLALGLISIRAGR